MNRYLGSLVVSSLLLASSAHAGIVALPPSVVPVDSPWALGALALALAVIGGRLLHNRRNK